MTSTTVYIFDCIPHVVLIGTPAQLAGLENHAPRLDLPDQPTGTIEGQDIAGPGRVAPRDLASAWPQRVGTPRGVESRTRCRPGWEKIRGSVCGGKWRHLSSGWIIQHCGRPTANWPYAAYEGIEGGQTLMTPSGHGFGKLVDAQMAVEALLAGRGRA